MNQQSALIIAAAILGVAILAGSWMIRSSLDAGTAELQGVTTSLAEFKDALTSAARPQPAARRPSGPDPNRRYQVKTDGAPSLGLETAKVTIVEFSDFQ
jgi:protein-disulfide isomerase